MEKEQEVQSAGSVDKRQYEIVPVDKIPTEVTDTPVENLMELYKICQEMEKICDEQKGIGLSAVQVGIPWRFFIYRATPDEYHYMVDCEYEPISEEKAVSIEGCLSLKTETGKLRHFRLERYRGVRIKGKRLLTDDDLRLEDVDFEEADNIYSVVCQHEIDHHHGVLISEIGDEIDIERLQG